MLTRSKPCHLFTDSLRKPLPCGVFHDKMILVHQPRVKYLPNGGQVRLVLSGEN